MKINQIAEKKKRQKFADIPCPGCGDPKCDHKQEHMTEGQTTTDYVDYKEFGDYIKQYGGTDVDAVANKVLAALQVHKTKSQEIFYKVEAEAGYNVNGKPVDKSLIRKIVPKRIPDDVVGEWLAKSRFTPKGVKLKPNWNWKQDPEAFTQHPDMIKLRNFIQDKIQQALDSGDIPITIQHFDQDEEMAPLFRLNIQTNEGTRCWKGYKKKGMKTMFGKRVPNCVKEEVTSGNRNIALNLPRGEMKVLKAEEKDYDRGLLVKLLDNGGYEMAYWYEKHVPFPVEVIVDGKSISKDAKIVEMKFHPELTPGAEDKGMRFKLYDIEADIKDLRDKLEKTKVKEVDTGNPHKGKYVIKTDEPGRKSSDIVVMPDEKEAKDMVASLSKKKPNVNFWLELVEEIDIDLTKPPIRAELPDMSLPNAPAFNNQKLSTAVQKRYPAPADIKDNVNTIVTQVIKNNNLKGPWKKAVMHDKKSGIGMAFISNGASDTIVINWHHNHITGVLVNKKPVRSGVIDKNIHTLAPDGPQPQKYNPIDKTKQEIDPVLKKRLDTPN